MINDRPILVTGSHRSGTTWIGHCLGLSGKLGFIWEPFSKSYCPPFLVNPPPHWFFKVPAQESEYWELQLRDLLNFRYRWHAKINHYRSLYSIGKASRDAAQLLSYRMRRVRPLLKDPIALMSAGWIEDCFNAQVVVSVRHPAAFVESMKRQEGAFPWEDLLIQNELMNEELSSFSEQIEKAAEGALLPLEEHILLWNVLYGYLKNKIEEGRGWIVVKHEALVRDTVPQYARLYHNLSLPLTPEIERRLVDAKMNVADKWKTRLERDEIRAVRCHTEEIASHYYSDEDWC